MRRIDLSDLSVEEVWKSKCDWLIVGVGAESRSSFIINRLIKQAVEVKNVLLFCYPDAKKEVRDRILRMANRLVCSERVWNVEVGSDAHDVVYQILNERIDKSQVCSVMVDYSGMSRVWYASILSWFYRSYPEGLSAQLTFLYTEGVYTEKFALKDVVIKETRAVPGCEGMVYRQRPTSLVLGLGFWGYASLCVCDLLEPDSIYTLDTKEDPLKTCPIERQQGNLELIKRARGHFRMPLESVVAAYRCMSEIAVAEILDGYEVIIVPMGPKTHVLAAILVSLSNHEVCVMRVRHNHYLDDVKPNGKIVATRIEFIDVDIPVSDR